MGRLGIHSFVWTNGKTQEGLERALEKTAEHGFRTIEFAYLKPELFDLDRLAKKAQSLDVEIGVTMGLKEGRLTDDEARGLLVAAGMAEEAAVAAITGVRSPNPGD